MSVSHTSVGDYRQYIQNYSLCGLSRNILQFPDPCFEFHKNTFAPIMNARDTLLGEAPWVALLDVSWGGRYNSIMIITNQNQSSNSVIAFALEV